MEQKKKLKEKVFQKFVRDVLERKSISCEKSIVFDYKEKAFGDNAVLIEFDAFCENGFEEYVGPVIFEIRPRNLSQDAIRLFQERINNNTTLKRAKVIYVVNEKIDFVTLLDNTVILDLDTINRWIKDYPIEYFNALNSKDELEISNKGKNEEVIPYEDDEFERIKEIYIKGLGIEVRKGRPLGLVLGAGVSIEQGAKKWNDLLLDLKQLAQKRGLADDSNKLADKVGGSSLTTAQMCKDIFKNERDFLWEVHQSLYPQKSFTLKKGSELEAVARLANRHKNLRHFRILTYNFDDYLERYLNDVGVVYTILDSVKDEYFKGKTKAEVYEMNGKITNEFNVYHVHGYLPYSSNKTSLRGSICLTEADYNLLYNQPYSWPIISQMSFFRENMCLFIGCSLTDPNIRRLLELACTDGRWHYAIIHKEGLSTKDLAQATAHFYRLGVRIIWIDDYSEISAILDRI